VDEEQGTVHGKRLRKQGKMQYGEWRFKTKTGREQ
jgi:hypothetical protein